MELECAISTPLLKWASMTSQNTQTADPKPTSLVQLQELGWVVHQLRTVCKADISLVPEFDESKIFQILAALTSCVLGIQKLQLYRHAVVATSQVRSCLHAGKSLTDHLMLACHRSQSRHLQL